MDTAMKISGLCQAGHNCHQPLRFQARLEADGNCYPIHRTAEFCAEHLGTAVHDLTVWAHRCGLTRGNVTVAIVSDTPGSIAGPANAGGVSSGFAFSTIPLSA